VPKTATHSIREVLRPNLEAQDWEQQVLFGKDLSPIPEIASIGHGHIQVTQIKPFLTEEQWSSYYKFAFVRNPFDRFVSVCTFLNRDNPEFGADPLQWMKLALDRPRFLARPLVQPQFNLLSDASDNLAVDYIGRYETLQSSLDEVLNNLNLPTHELQQLNASNHAEYQKYFDAELKNRVTDLYQRDLSEFSYEF